MINCKICKRLVPVDCTYSICWTCETESNKVNRHNRVLKLIIRKQNPLIKQLQKELEKSVDTTNKLYAELNG